MKNQTPNRVPQWPSEPPKTGEALGQMAPKQKAAAFGQKGCDAPSWKEPLVVAKVRQTGKVPECELCQ